MPKIQKSVQQTSAVPTTGTDAIIAEKLRLPSKSSQLPNGAPELSPQQKLTSRNFQPLEPQKTQEACCLVDEDDHTQQRGDDGVGEGAGLERAVKTVDGSEMNAPSYESKAANEDGTILETAAQAHLPQLKQRQSQGAAGKRCLRVPSPITQLETRSQDDRKKRRRKHETVTDDDDNQFPGRGSGGGSNDPEQIDHDGDLNPIPKPQIDGQDCDGSEGDMKTGSRESQSGQVDSGFHPLAKGSLQSHAAGAKQQPGGTQMVPSTLHTMAQQAGVSNETGRLRQQPQQPQQQQQQQQRQWLAQKRSLESLNAPPPSPRKPHTTDVRVEIGTPAPTMLAQNPWLPAPQLPFGVSSSGGTSTEDSTLRARQAGLSAVHSFYARAQQHFLRQMNEIIAVVSSSQPGTTSSASEASTVDAAAINRACGAALGIIHCFQHAASDVRTQSAPIFPHPAPVPLPQVFMPCPAPMPPPLPTTSAREFFPQGTMLTGSLPGGIFPAFGISQPLGGPGAVEALRVPTSVPLSLSLQPMVPIENESLGIDHLTQPPQAMIRVATVSPNGR